MELQQQKANPSQILSDFADSAKVAGRECKFVAIADIALKKEVVAEFEIYAPRKLMPAS